MIKKVVKKQNVGMVFDEHSVPVAIYYKNSFLKFYSIKEMNETELDKLMEADTPESIT